MDEVWYVMQAEATKKSVECIIRSVDDVCERGIRGFVHYGQSDIDALVRFFVMGKMME